MDANGRARPAVRLESGRTVMEAGERAGGSERCQSRERLADATRDHGESVMLGVWMPGYGEGKGGD